MNAVSKRRAVAIAAAALLASTIAGCGDDNSSSETAAVSDQANAESGADGAVALTGPPTKNKAVGLGEFFSRRQAEAGAFPRWYDDITDLLPNVEYTSSKGQRPIADAVVVGKIVDVQPGVGFDQDELADESRIVQTKFEDPLADYVTAHLVVDVFDRLGPGKSVSDRITVGLAMNSAADLERIRPDLLSMQSSVFFLVSNSPVFAYDPSLFAIVQDGEMLTEVKDGQLSIPAKKAVNPEDEKKLLSKAPRLDDLKAAGKRPKEIRKVPGPEAP